MRTSYFSKALAICLTILITLSLSGAFAAWYYCETPLASESDDTNFSLSIFTWKPEEILPTEKPGENYMVLLDSILNNSKGGLNSGKGTLENATKKDRIVHSSQNVQGGNLKHLFVTEPCKELDFIVQYITATEFHVYMYEENDVNAGTVNVTQIKFFKTILVETNGEWTAQESQLGYSTMRYVQDTNYIALFPEEWVMGTLPH